MKVTQLEQLTLLQLTNTPLYLDTAGTKVAGFYIQFNTISITDDSTFIFKVFSGPPSDSDLYIDIRKHDDSNWPNVDGGFSSSYNESSTSTASISKVSNFSSTTVHGFDFVGLNIIMRLIQCI